MEARPSAVEAAKRCSCKPCQPRLALAIERAIREAEEALIKPAEAFVALAVGLCAREAWDLDDGGTPEYEALMDAIARAKGV